MRIWALLFVSVLSSQANAEAEKFCSFASAFETGVSREGTLNDWLAVGLDLRAWLPAGVIYVGAEAGFRIGADLSRDETLHYSTRVGGFVGYSYHLGEKWQLRPELVAWGRQAEQRMDGAVVSDTTRTLGASLRGSVAYGTKRPIGLFLEAGRTFAGNSVDHSVTVGLALYPF